MLLLNTHLRHQIDINRLEQRNVQLGSYLEATQVEVDQGLRVEFPIPRQLLGVAIGSGGANIKSVLEKTGVDKIVIDDEVSDVCGKGPQNGLRQCVSQELVIRIVGKSKEAVQRARELMEFRTETISVSDPYLEQVTRPFGNGNFNKLREIQQSSRALSVSQGDGANPSIEIMGQKSAVETAVLLLQTDYNYFKKFNSLNAEKQQIQSELRKLDQLYGYRVSVQ